MFTGYAKLEESKLGAWKVLLYLDRRITAINSKYVLNGVVDIRGKRFEVLRITIFDISRIFRKRALSYEVFDKWVVDNVGMVNLCGPLVRFVTSARGAHA